MPLNNVVTGVVTDADANGVPFYYQQEIVAYQYLASLQVAKTFGVGPLAAVTTFGIYNPNNSGISIIAKVCNISLSAAPAAATVFYYTATTVVGADPTAVTPLTAVPCRFNNSRTALGIPFSAATLNTIPTIIRSHQSILASGVQAQSIFEDQINGRIVLPPGTALAIQASAVSSAFISMVWEELQSPSAP